MKMVNMLQKSTFESCQYQCSTKKAKQRKRKHVPHSQRSPEYVRHRNTRERKRVEAMNDAFLVLKKHIPYLGDSDDRMSKAAILHGAARYIKLLGDILGSNSTSTDFNENTLQERRTEGEREINVLRNHWSHVPYAEHSQRKTNTDISLYMEIQDVPAQADHIPNMFENTVILCNERKRGDLTTPSWDCYTHYAYVPSDLMWLS